MMFIQNRPTHFNVGRFMIVLKFRRPFRFPAFVSVPGGCFFRRKEFRFPSAFANP